MLNLVLIQILLLDLKNIYKKNREIHDFFYFYLSSDHLSNDQLAVILYVPKFGTINIHVIFVDQYQDAIGIEYQLIIANNHDHHQDNTDIEIIIGFPVLFVYVVQKVLLAVTFCRVCHIHNQVFQAGTLVIHWICQVASLVHIFQEVYVQFNFELTKLNQVCDIDVTQSKLPA